MVAALVVIALIAVGLPLLAWWVGGRGFWGRLRPTPVRLVPSELRARYRLTVLELTEVHRAAAEGRALTDPRLRAATAEHARRTLARLQRRWPDVLMVLGAVLLIALIAVMVVWGDGSSWNPMFWILLCINPVAQGLLRRRLRTRLQRAVELNTDQDAASRQNGSGGHVSPGRVDS